MPKPMLRVHLVLSTLIATSFIAVAGAGFASADPEDAGNGSGGETGSGASTPGESDPAKPTTRPATTTARPPSIFDIPRTITTQLHDLFGKPQSVVGDGRTPRVHRVPAPPRRLAPSGHPDRLRPEKPAATTPKQLTVVRPSPRSTVSVAPAVPGHHGAQLTLDPRTPAGALALRSTVNTVNSLLSDAYAPPRGVVPPGVVGPRSPATDPAIAGQSPGTGPGAVRPPASVGPILRPGVGSAQEAPPTGVAERSGYPPYLRSERIGELVAAALPGVAGLLTLTACGGVVGYRQADCGRYLRSGAARFLS